MLAVADAGPLSEVERAQADLLHAQAIGAEPSVGVVALGYMLGQLGNIVPVPGGLGGVESVMLAVFTASGVSSSRWPRRPISRRCASR